MPELVTPAPAAAVPPPAVPTPPATPAQATPAPAAGEVAVPKTPTPEAPASPADVEIALPQGFTPDPEQLGAFKAWAKESGLKSAQAQKLFDSYVGWQEKRAKAQAEADAKTWEQTKTAWLQKAKDHPELGGQNFGPNSDFANKAVREFFDPDTFKWLQETGLTAHTGFWAGMVKAGKAIADDRIDRGSKEGDKPKTPEDVYREMYQNSPGLFEKR